MKQQLNEIKRMQRIAGLITESEYQKSLMNEALTADELYKEFEEEDLLNDRREYDVEDLMSAYPGLSKKEAEKLEQMLQSGGDESRYMSTDSVPKEKVEEFIWYDAEEGTDLEYMNIMNSFLDKLLAGSKEVTRKQFYQLIDYGYDQPGHGPIGHGADPNTDELFNDLLDN